MSKAVTALAALLAAPIIGCAYKAPSLPSIPVHAPAPTRIYVIAHGEPLAQSSGWLGWTLAAKTALALEQAGFVPVIVSHSGEAPTGAPLVDHLSPTETQCITEWAPWLVLSLGLIPDWGCDSYGRRFDLHRARGEPAQTIDTYYSIDRMRGWAAFLVNLRDDYVADPPPAWTHDYEIDALRAAVQDALEAP
jgi:hypothetical protein